MKTIILENTWLTGCKHGWGNGYVLLEKNHPLFGVHYRYIDSSVHGGITYSEFITPDNIKYFGDEINESDIGKWCLGFDTAHSSDSLENWTKEKVQEETYRFESELLNFTIKIY